MTKTIAVSLLALTLALTSLAPAAATGILGNGNGGGGSGSNGSFPDPSNDDDDDDDDDFGGIWDLPPPGGGGPKIEINRNIEIKRPKLDNPPIIDILGPDGEPLDEEEVAKLNLGDVGLICAVAGTPSEFPDDILISNVGLVDVPKGARIGWHTEEPDLSGMTVLTKTLKAGRSIKLNGVLAGGLDPETVCLIKAPGA